MSQIHDLSQAAFDYLKTIEIINKRCSFSEVFRKKELRRWIYSELKEAGYEENKIRANIFKGQVENDTIPFCNISVDCFGKNSETQIIIGAHYDGTGVGDNGSGVALLLAFLVSLKLNVISLKCNVRAVFFDGEEYGSIGSTHFVENMSFSELKKTELFVNIDSIAFGDYCNVYSGVTTEEKATSNSEMYDYIIKRAKEVGVRTVTTGDLDGYYQRHGRGPQIEKNTIYTNPWTKENPAPKNSDVVSPATYLCSDHEPFAKNDIPYVFFEATNWFADGGEDDLAYTGYYETIDTSIGKNGMFMNTEFDTLENLEKLFPNRAQEHFRIFSILLSAIVEA